MEQSFSVRKSGSLCFDYNQTLHAKPITMQMRHEIVSVSTKVPYKSNGAFRNVTALQRPLVMRRVSVVFS